MVDTFFLPVFGVPSIATPYLPTGPNPLVITVKNTVVVSKVLLCSGEDFDFLVVALNTGVQVPLLLPGDADPLSG